MTKPFIQRLDEGVQLFVKLTPKAKKNAINASMLDVDDQEILKVSVTAVPEKGKANAALIKLLSKEWKIAKTQISLTSGDTDRRKTLLLAGNSEELSHRIMQWMKQNNV